MAILSRLKRTLARKTDVVTFDRLDYWTMLELFDCIPLYDLVRLNGLASWWPGYVHKVCLTKRSISVHCGYKTDESIAGGDSKDKVKVVTIDSTTSDRLGHLLPKVTTLEVIIGGSQPFTLSDVTYLINQWSHQLVDLQLIFDSTFVSVEAANYGNDQFYGLLISLNRITTLRRLTVHSESDQCRLKDPIDLPVLAQLEYFYFLSGLVDFSKLRTSLVQYAGPNLALAQIELPTFVWSDRMHDDWDLLEQRILFKFTKLRIVKATRDEWSLFPNLHFAHHILGTLRSRSRFMELISEMQSSHVRTLGMTFFISLLFDSGQVLTNAPPLQSVTKLHLNVVVWQKYINLYSDFKSLKIDHKMFPNVQAVNLTYNFLRIKACPLGHHFLKIWHKISTPMLYRKLKLRVRRDFPDAKCTFEQRVSDVR